tara:strand:+ start:566 stop:697 length:132 start_codon:yes stop_codon:yes gene_type:complete
MIPKELIIIILGALLCGIMMYRDDYKLKKERDKYDREKHLPKS